MALINLTSTTLIGLSAKKVGQLRFHQCCQVLSKSLFDIKPDHLKKFLRLFFNLPENFYNFRYANIHFHESPGWTHSIARDAT